MRRRLPVVLALVAALASASAGIARADGAPADPTVTIAPSRGGPERTLSLIQLAGSFDVHHATYTLRAADGTRSTVTVAKGISLGALIAAAGLDGDPFTYVEIPWPDAASSSYVPTGQVGDAGGGPPVVWTDSNGVHFLRPSAGRGDPNADDDLTFPDGTLALDLHTGELLVPRVEVSTAAPAPGQTVRFRASLAAGTLGPGMTFQWYFDGGALVYGASVTHRFTAAGTYKVQLNVVRGTASVTNLPTIVHIRVATLARRRSGGAAQGSVTGGGAAGGGSNAGGSGVDTGHGAGAGSGGPSAAGGGAPAHAVPSASASRPRTPVATAHRPPPLPAPQGRLVSGTLIASASAALPLASGGARADSAAPAGAAARGPLHVPVGAWVAIGLAVLLGLGWALESRHTLPFWQP